MKHLGTDAVAAAAIAAIGGLAVTLKALQQREFDWQIDPLALPATLGVAWSAVHLARGAFGRALVMVPLSWVAVWLAALAWWAVVGSPWILAHRPIAGAAYIATVITCVGFALGMLPLLFAWRAGMRERRGPSSRPVN